MSTLSSTPRASSRPEPTGLPRDLIEAREKPKQAEQQAADNSSGEAQSHIPNQAEPLALPSDYA